MGTKTVRFSDLTNKIIDDDDDLVRVVIEQHPALGPTAVSVGGFHDHELVHPGCGDLRTAGMLLSVEVIGVSGGAAVVEGSPRPARNAARRGVEARRSRVARSAIAQRRRRRLDLGGTAPQAARRRRRHPRKRHKSPALQDGPVDIEVGKEEAGHP